MLVDKVRRAVFYCLHIRNLSFFSGQSAANSAASKSRAFATRTFGQARHIDEGRAISGFKSTSIGQRQSWAEYQQSGKNCGNFSGNIK
jgi:hypothetical protein